jgi:uncharacterized membrane protein (UPF0127 family)
MPTRHVAIVDETTGRTLAAEARVAERFGERLRGLMFTARLRPGEGLVIVPCASIHMLGMRFPIDAVFFDRAGVVTKVVRGLRPWVGLAFAPRGTRGVAVLPLGAAVETEAGHRLRFEPPL